MSNATFNNLPEAQAFARANGIAKYWRVHFTDTDTRTMRARGGHWPDMTPAYRIYMSLDMAIREISQRANGTAERTEIETLWTADVSDSTMAQ